MESWERNELSRNVTITRRFEMLIDMVLSIAWRVVYIGLWHMILALEPLIF